MKRISLKLEVLDDLHVGTGTGRGDIDSSQIRDRRGVPVIPATHIKGVLRATAFDMGFDPSLIDRLFGRSGQGQGLLQLTSAFAVGDIPSMTTWGGTRIDPKTGSAQEDSLRFVEYVSAGSQFRLDVTLGYGCDENDIEVLKDILRSCRYLGGGRNRGHGRVRWQMSNDLNAAPQALKATTLAQAPRLRLILRNLEPICLAATGHPGNIIHTESFIRGRSLRGAFTAACIAMGRMDWAEQLIDPTLIWANALPLPEIQLEHTDFRSLDVLAIPLSVGTPKAQAQRTDLPWWVEENSSDYYGAREEIDQLTQIPTLGGQKLKRPNSNEFLFRKNPNSAWVRYKPQIMVRLHTRVPTRDKPDQALFSTEEIAEKTLFCADLILTQPAQIGLWQELLSRVEWLRMGRGGKPICIEHAEWMPAPPTAKAVQDSFTLLLESELIFRNAHGNFIERLSAESLANMVGMPDAHVTTEKVFGEGVDLYGFNALTGLPRHTQRGIKAGSVIRIGGNDAHKLRDALASHVVLGENPEEGFGRFRLDSLPLPVIESDVLSEQSKPTESKDEATCREARDWVHRFAGGIEQPSASQWGDFRARILAANSMQDIEDTFDATVTSAEKLGGKAWKKWTMHNQFSALRQELKRASLHDAIKFLDFFVRWVRANTIQREAE